MIMLNVIADHVDCDYFLLRTYSIKLFNLSELIFSQVNFFQIIKCLNPLKGWNEAVC